MQVVIPAAGRAPGPDAAPPAFQPLLGRPRIEHALATCGHPGHDLRIVVVLDAEQERRFGLRARLAGIAPGSQAALAMHPTQGALCTGLLASDLLDPEQSLLVCLSDAHVTGGIADGLAFFAASGADVGIVTFPDADPRWSYIRLDAAQRVVETAEKRPIGEFATAGFYWYRRAGEFIEAGERAIRNGRSDFGSFFIAPAINESIAAGREVRHWPVERERFFALSHDDDLVRFAASGG